MICGPNGSGKSTIFKEIQSKYDVGVYINADEIEKELRSRGQYDLSRFGVELIKEEEFFNFVNNSSLTQKANHLGVPIHLSVKGASIIHKSEGQYGYEAALLAEYSRQLLLEKGKKMTFETVMSHKSKIEIIKKANQLGYKSYVYFVGTKDPLINIQRVNLRVKKGGHDVPKEKIEKRYYESLTLLKEAVKHSYRAFVWDNSEKSPKLILEIYQGKEVTSLSSSIPHWISKYLLS